MEAALERLSKTGPEYHGRLANHGPMAAEALVVMDRPDAVVPWVDFYRKRLYDHPSGSRPIDPAAWREALGQGDRVGDWIVFFDRRLAEEPWRTVLVEWVPRLSPGIIAAAFHGVIRTAHGVRSLDARETPARRRELAEGLAYWAATYNELPESKPRVPGRRKPSEAIGEVQAVPPDKRQSYGNIVDRLTPLDTFPPFAGVADYVDATGDSSAFISNLTETFAAAYLVNVPNGGSVITYLHGVTGPSAMRLLLPHLDAPARAEMLRYGWQGAAGVYSASGGVPGPPAIADSGGSFDDLIDRAIATKDEHAIKFTEACRREHALNPKPIYFAAARDAVARLG
jgi:Questin oxidase-like